jgi:hypothetical protein
LFLPFSKRAKEWEPHALKLRAMVQGHGAQLRFNPLELAPKVGLTVAPVTFKGLSPDELRHLRTQGSSHWSGGVYPVPLPDGSYLCMLNPDGPPRRNRITLMEEICHRFFNHEPTKLLIRADGLLVRDFNDAQEKAAFGVGAAVLMPWSLFFRRLNQGMSSVELSEEFDVTTQLAEYRIKITGATKLYQARQRARFVAAQAAVGL